MRDIRDWWLLTSSLPPPSDHVYMIPGPPAKNKKKKITKDGKTKLIFDFRWIGMWETTSNLIQATQLKSSCKRSEKSSSAPENAQ